MTIAFVKTKTFYFLLAILVGGGLFGYRSYQKSHALPQYETATVTKGTLRQTVHAVGKIQAIDDLSLHFEIPGTIEAVHSLEGKEVKAGTTLATLRLKELNAQVAQAQANLNQKLAGATVEDKKYYKAGADAARAALEQVKIDATTAVATAGSGVATAKNNLQLAEGGEQSEIVNQTYEDSVAILQTTLSKLNDALTQSDNILAVDNTLANASFKSALALLHPSKLDSATTLYINAKNKKEATTQSVQPLSTHSTHLDIDSGLSRAQDALIETTQLLLGVIEVLQATLPVGDLSQSSLDAKKTTIETSRSTIASQYTTLINQKQIIADAKNSYETYRIAYEKSLTDLNKAKSDALTSVAIKQATYDQALANYESKVNPPREVDIAAYRAALAQSIAARDKAILKAPIDGIITKINKKKGEFIGSSETMIQLLSPNYEIQVDIPETDIAKLKVGNSTEITVDALGTETIIPGTVLTIDPNATEIQDVIYYQVHIGLEKTDKPIKPGMTANVRVITALRDQTLTIPLRAVRSKEAAKYIRILVNTEVKEVPVTLGIKGDEGKVEVTEGIQEGDHVIVNTKP